MKKVIQEAVGAITYDMNYQHKNGMDYVTILSHPTPYRHLLLTFLVSPLPNDVIFE